MAEIRTSWWKEEMAFVHQEFEELLAVAAVVLIAVAGQAAVAVEEVAVGGLVVVVLEVAQWAQDLPALEEPGLGLEEGLVVLVELMVVMVVVVVMEVGLKLLVDYPLELELERGAETALARDLAMDWVWLLTPFRIEIQKLVK